jgi:phosphate ABC transporter phosphate-binding protein
MPGNRVVGFLAIAMMLGACQPNKFAADDKEEIIAGGSIGADALMKRWSYEYERIKNTVSIDYTRVGSKAGIDALLRKKLNFCVSDYPLSEEQLKSAKTGGLYVLQVPIVLTGVVPVYNLKGLEKPLNLTGPILADIFLGKIKKWNDPVIAKSNPGADLPDLGISVFFHSGQSATTLEVTEYLSCVSEEWKNRVGSGFSVEWPVGEPIPKASGTANIIAQTPGAISFVDYSYSVISGLKQGAIKNRAGRYVPCDLEAIRASVEGQLDNIPLDLRMSLIDCAGDKTYPMCSAMWAIWRRDAMNAKGPVYDFLVYALGKGQDETADVHLACLPKKLRERILETLNKKP